MERPGIILENNVREDTTSPVAMQWARGFSLVEVMVAAALVAFSFIGLVSAQKTALAITSKASLRTTGLQLAADLEERIRGNLPVAFAIENAADTARDECTEDCIEHIVPDHILEPWQTLVGSSLPGGASELTWNAEPRTLRVRITWQAGFADHKNPGCGTRTRACFEWMIGLSG